MKGHAGHSRCGPLVALCRCHARSMNYTRCRRKQLSWTPLRLIRKSHVDSPLNHVFTFLYIKTLRKTLQLYPRLYSPHPSLGKVTLPSAPSAPLQSPQLHTHKLCSRPTGVPFHKARVSHGAVGELYKLVYTWVLLVRFWLNWSEMEEPLNEDTWSFKSSPGDSNAQPWLRTTADFSSPRTCTVAGSP